MSTSNEPPTDPQDNLLGDLATARAAGELSDLTALNIMATLFSAGGESTASLIGSAAYVLATRPDIQQRVRENPDLLGAFLEEVLRYEPPFRGHYRHVVSDTTLHGVDLGAGSRLVLLWGAANRDPSHFDDANDFRLDRRRRQGAYLFRQGRPLLRRRRARPPGSQRSSSAELLDRTICTSRPPKPADGCPACWCDDWSASS